VADLDDAPQSRQSLLIDLFVGQEFRIIEEIPQKPAKLPHHFLRAVETAGDGLPGQRARLENGESKDVEPIAPADLA
jgi:hypothetical protein